MDPIAQFKRVAVDTDILIIGGGTAGCLAAVEAREKYPHLKVTILEKAHIDRSGCLAGGMNAINAYLNADETPESFTKFVRADSMGLIREDLVRSQAELFEYCVKKVESWGLPVKKEADGKTYMVRGRWNIRINGESLKPILARAVRAARVEVLNWTAVTNLIVREGRVAGAFGFSVRKQEFVIARAKAVIIATGGAAGLYRPNNQHDAQHKTWYCPFNTGAGYAMGIRAGAEMTSFEMRYIALRTKDVIAPTGTVALGANAPFLNGKGENFMQLRWKHMGGDRAATPIRAYAPILEIKEGRGPVYLDTTHLDREGVRKLKEAFLDMYPDQVLYWLANDIDPGETPVEVETTEPYIVGGHCQSGYWVDANRATTVPNLYAAGDVAGGAPYKFVSGCWAEGVIAARAAGAAVEKIALAEVPADLVESEVRRVYAPFFHRSRRLAQLRPFDFEHRLQKIMEEYAGGASTFYDMNEERLVQARKQLARLPEQFPFIEAHDLHDLMLAHSVMDRVDVAQVLVEHLIARKETRWPGYQTRLDYPERDDARWSVFVNSRRDPATGKIEVFTRPYEQLIPGDRYTG
jgi:adenylylsulfate reductase subunit A